MPIPGIWSSQPGCLPNAAKVTRDRAEAFRPCLVVVSDDLLNKPFTVVTQLSGPFLLFQPIFEFGKGLVGFLRNYKLSVPVDVELGIREWNLNSPPIAVFGSPLLVGTN